MNPSTAPPPTGKWHEVRWTVTTDQEHLAQVGLTLDDLQQKIKDLGGMLGTKYLEVLPVDVRSEHLEEIIDWHDTLSRIRDCDGYARHVAEYSGTTRHSNYFVARTAAHFRKEGYEVELEPDMGSREGPHPDLRVTSDGEFAYVECKTSNIDNYTRFEAKRVLAEKIFATYQTCDQVDLHVSELLPESEIIEAIGSPDAVQAVYRSYRQGADGQQTIIELNPGIELCVIQRPAVVGDHPLEVWIDGHRETTDTGDRLPGVQLMRDGRSVGVYTLADYGQKLQDKHEQSKHQMITGQANLVVLDDSTVVGSPAAHRNWIDEHWLTPDLSACSGVAMLGHYRSPDGSVITTMKYYPNAHADIPLHVREITLDDFFGSNDENAGSR